MTLKIVVTQQQNRLKLAKTIVCIPELANVKPTTEGKCWLDIQIYRSVDNVFGSQLPVR